MHRIEFNRRQAFLLEDSNLQRMLGIVHASFDHAAYKLIFNVVLTSGKKLQFDSAEDLLRHDNTVANSIHHLKVQAEGTSESLSCSIFFYGEKEPHLSGITVNVESQDQRRATSLSAELEEQLERIKMPGLVYQLRQSVGFRNLFTALLIPVAIAVSLFGASANLLKMSSAGEVNREILLLAEKAKTQEEKIDVLFKAQVATLSEKTSASVSSAIRLPSINAKLAIGLLPVLISLVLLWYLIKYCYPPAVFSWGDSGNQFQKLLERRKNLWSILVTVIVLGFLVNLSSPVISSWLGV